MEYNAKFYMAHNHSSLEEAIERGGVSSWETTYGYTSTRDSLSNVRNAIQRLDFTAIADFRFVWTIEGTTFPEMNFSESIDLIDAVYQWSKSEHFTTNLDGLLEKYADFKTQGSTNQFIYEINPETGKYEVKYL